MDAAYNRRRSNTSLNRLSLAPLTSKLPLNDEHELAALDAGPVHHRPSYREGKSAPATPANLSRNPSTHRPRLKTPQSQQQCLPKSKSSSHLPPHRSRRTHALKPLAKNQPSSSSSEWLFRAGTVLSSEARESKGQSWLVGRESSTSLVSYAGDDDDYPDRVYHYNDDDDNDAVCSRQQMEDPAFADDEFSPISARASSGASRIASRRTSRIGSRVELRTPLKDVEEDIFDENYFAREPDFVNGDDDGELNEREIEEEDAEMDELTRQQESGLTGWLDRFMKWSLFVAEDDDDDLENPAEKDGAEKGKRSSSSSCPAEVLPRIPASLDDQPQLEGGKMSNDDRLRGEEKVEGWQDDAAWLLSVASKIFM